MALRFGWMVSLALLLCGVVAGPVAAQEIVAADRAAIAARVGAFDAAMRAGRIGDTIDFMPPRLLKAIATQSGVGVEELRPAMAQQAAEAFKVVKLLSYGMDLAAASTGLTPDRSQGYMLIPTDTVMQMPDGRRIQSRSTTLALRDGGQWYLMRIDSPAHLAKLRETYPEFVGVEVPRGSMSAVD